MKKQAVLLILLATLAIVKAQDAGVRDEKTILDNLVGQNPTSSLPRDWRGGYYMSRKEYDAAEKEFITAVSLDPTDSFARLRLGEVKELLGKPQEALEQYSGALERASYPIELRMARCHHLLGQEKKAIALFNQLQKIQDSASLHFGIALCEAGLKDYDQALKELDAVETFGLDHPPIDNLRNEWKEKRKQRLAARILCVFGLGALLVLWSQRKTIFFRAPVLEVEEEF